MAEPLDSTVFAPKYSNTTLQDLPAKMKYGVSFVDTNAGAHFTNDFSILIEFNGKLVLVELHCRCQYSHKILNIPRQLSCRAMYSIS